MADIPYECFSVVSSQSSKFEEHKCRQKWENIVSSYADEPKDINQLIRFMKNIGINVQLGYSTDVSSEKLDFSVFMFDKETMIDYNDEDNPKVKSEYTGYTIDTLNRFFGIVALTKMEIFQVRYGEDGNIVEVVQRFSKTPFLDAFQPIGVFVKYWLSCQFRRQFCKYIFQPELPIQ